MTKKEYMIQLRDHEVRHFELAVKLNDEIFDKFGYVTALVGGASRDLFVRHFHNEVLDIHDLDFAIYKQNGNGLNDIELTELMEFIRKEIRYDVVDEIKFLHLKVITPEKYEIEYTSTRKEAYRNASRKPETIVGDIESDHMRRDFTINSIFINIGDIFGNNMLSITVADAQSNENIEDVKNKILKTSNPNIEQTFKDDKLRLLRAVRFSNYYNMTSELEKIVRNYPRQEIYTNVSMERIIDELIKILKKGNVDYFIKSEFVLKIIPEFDIRYSDDVVGAVKNAREMLYSLKTKENEESNIVKLLTALLFKTDETQIENIMLRYKLSHNIIRRVTKAISLYYTPDWADTMEDWVFFFLNNKKENIDDSVILAICSDDFGTSSKKLYDIVEKWSSTIYPILQQYKEELSNIGLEVNANKKIENKDKRNIITSKKVEFILNKIHK